MNNIFKYTFLLVLIFSFFYIFNFVTEKNEAFANINKKQIERENKIAKNIIHLFPTMRPFGPFENFSHHLQNLLLRHEPQKYLH